MTDQRLTAIERKLDEHGRALYGIQDTLNRVAVQNEQIAQLQKDVSSLWQKWDALAGPEGTIAQIVRYQASCPRGQMRFLWWVIVTILIALVGLGSSFVSRIL